MYIFLNETNYFKLCKKEKTEACLLRLLVSVEFHSFYITKLERRK